MHACTHHTDAHADSYDSSSELKVGGVVVWQQLARREAGEERTWSRAGGGREHMGGFMIQHECILFIFSRTLPIIGEGPTERKRRRGIGWKLIQTGFSSTSIPTWGQCVPRYRLCGVRSLSLYIHPPSNPQRSKYPITPPGCRFGSSSALTLQDGPT